jgi:hypothetical protein
MTDTTGPGADVRAQTASETAERADHPFSDAEVENMRTAKAASDDPVAAVVDEQPEARPTTSVRELPREPGAAVREAGTATEGRWLALLDAAVALGVSGDTVRRRVRRGELPSRHDERGRLIVELPAATSPPADAEPGPAVEASELLAALRARIAELERDRDQWRGQAQMSIASLQQLTAALPRLHDPADYVDGASDPATMAHTAPRRRRWWQRGGA